MLNVLLAFVALYEATIPIRQAAVRTFLDGVHLGDVQFGEHSVTLGDLISMDEQDVTAAGQIGMNATTGRPRAYIGGASRDLLGGHEVVNVDGSNAMAAALAMGSNKITGLAAGSATGDAVRFDEAITEDGANAFTGDQSMGGNKLTNLGAPTGGSTDAATAAYVDSKVSGATQGLFWKEPADYFAEISGLPAYTSGGGGATLTADANGAFPAQDGETPAGGEFYLVAEFGAANADAGLYELTTLGDAGNPWVLTRRDDFAVGAEVNGVVCTVDGGSTYAERSFRINNDAGNATVGTHALAWAPFGKSIDHGNVLGLGDDDHTQYVAKAGRSGGQTIQGDTAASGKLILDSTSDATKGAIELAAGNKTVMKGNDQFVPGTDGQGSVGTASRRFGNVYGVNVVSGDHHFEAPDRGASWTVTEEPDGLFAVNANTGDVFRLPMDLIDGSRAAVILARVRANRANLG